MSDRLAKARADLERAKARFQNAHTRSQAATPGGLTGYDSAVLSGIRRKPNPRADARRFAAYDEEAAAAVALKEAEDRVTALERAAARAERDAATKAEITPESLKAATHVRTRSGWYEVVRVNAKTVTVDSGWLGTVRFAHSQVLEARQIEGEA